MSIEWQKLGLLYSCQNLHPKLLSHAANPLPVHLEGNVYRVFFSARDENNRSSVGAVDIDIVQRKVIHEHTQPFFTYGQEGSFYSHGVSIGNTYEVDGVTYMLFMGWQNPDNDHWFGEIGRLIVNDDLTLELESVEPFMPLDDMDKISLSYPWVMQEEGIYKMWYGSTTTWNAGNDEMVHLIKYAESVDGHNWIKKNTSLPYQIGSYQAFSRPTVFKDSSNVARLFCSYRSGDGTPYRIGCYSSIDSKKWEFTHSGITISEEGWDSDMIEYPFVFSHNQTTYMLYNGNDFGKSGFGIAVKK